VAEQDLEEHIPGRVVRVEEVCLGCFAGVAEGCTAVFAREGLGVGRGAGEVVRSGRRGFVFRLAMVPGGLLLDFRAIMVVGFVR
jgi:hypothetical protein